MIKLRSMYVDLCLIGFSCSLLTYLLHRWVLPISTDKWIKGIGDHIAEIPTLFPQSGSATLWAFLACCGVMGSIVTGKLLNLFGGLLTLWEIKNLEEELLESPFLLEQISSWKGTHGERVGDLPVQLQKYRKEVRARRPVGVSGAVRRQWPWNEYNRYIRVESARIRKAWSMIQEILIADLLLNRESDKLLYLVTSHRSWIFARGVGNGILIAGMTLLVSMAAVTLSSGIGGVFGAFGAWRFWTGIGVYLFSVVISITIAKHAHAGFIKSLLSFYYAHIRMHAPSSEKSDV